MVPVAVASALPLRLNALHTRSAYTRVDRGYLPFDISGGPIDRVRAEVVVERSPTLQYLPMNAPEAAQQLVSGVYALEDNRTRWMAGQAVILLKSPAGATPLRVVFYTPNPRRVSLLLDGAEIASQSFEAGLHTMLSPPQRPAKPVATLTIAVDKTVSAPGDRRELGVVLSEAGFVP